ncbi:MAG TPA: LamG-like jellyroll fold domain-containing protein [Candidatus Acidoferrum sp.]|nr:LamG-like jellyroll fold domain-containing protein [Candidatus Acidoferrum sp.]
MRYHTHKALSPGLLAVLCFGAALCASAQTLLHRYSFNDTAGSTTFTDSVGTADGSLVNPNAPNSAYLDGSQLDLDGNGGYASLPANLISPLTQVTIEFWGTFSNGNANWTRVFAFGDANAVGGSLDYSQHAPGDWQNLNMATPADGDVWANNPGGLDGQTNVHVTCVVDPLGNKMYYYNGTKVTSDPVLNNGAGGTVPALSGLDDIYSLIGWSLFNGDSTLAGAINEFRIYSGVLSSSAVALNDVTGPDNIVTNPGPIQALHFSAPVNPLVVNQSSQQILTGDFTNVTGLDLIAYGGATFVSSNTAVVTISTNGVVKAIAPGTTKVVAIYGGLSTTNSLTVIALPAVLAHRYSFNGSDASDSVGGANGTLMGNATVTGGQLVLDGSAGTYVNLPAGIINITTNTAVTFEAWVTFGNPATWAYLFGFGNTNAGSGVNQIGCVPSSDPGGFHHWGITENFSAGRTPSWAHPWGNITAHITCVVDPPTGTISTYRDGVLELGEYDCTAPISSIPNNYGFIGRSFYDADPYLQASIDEFRIYSGALTPPQVALTHQVGPASAAIDVGALTSIVVPPTNYPAYASLVPPVILANYANLANFNLLGSVTAPGNAYFGGPQGLVVTSSDPTIISVNSQNLLTTHRPGSVTLTASFGGKTNSGIVYVKNQAVLAHRYSFNTDGDASDSVGGANGTLQGGATVSGGQLQLTGGNGDYLDLPPNLLTNYSSVTIDAWVNFGPVQNWARLWEFTDVGAATQNEFYFSPGWNNPPNANFYNAGFQWGGNVLAAGAPLGSAPYHITCLYGDGTLQVYTNGVLEVSASANMIAPAGNAGSVSQTIGHSPFNDPGINGSVDEFRIYRGRLAPDEILAEDVLGPNTLLTTTVSLKAALSAGNVMLSWPVAAGGFSVQAKSSLVSGSWVTLTNVPTLVGNATWQTAVPTTGGPQFFRLWR